MIQVEKFNLEPGPNHITIKLEQESCSRPQQEKEEVGFILDLEQPIEESMEEGEENQSKRSRTPSRAVG